MSDTPRDIAERLADDHLGSWSEGMRESYFRFAILVATAYGNAQRKAGAEDMREKCHKFAISQRDDCDRRFQAARRSKGAFGLEHKKEVVAERRMAAHFADAISALPVEVK